MIGNAWEWVNDWYGDYTPEPQTNPKGPVSGTLRMLRGGSWEFESGRVRSSYRLAGPAEATFHNIGFRVARDP
jgi:formylglycine-generating enzyme required for sulfatase activity